MQPFRQAAGGAGTGVPPWGPSALLQPGAPICAHCGVVATSQHAKCPLCSQPYPYPRVQAPSSSDGTYWVAVRCAFQCRSCHFLSPLDGLDIDGSVECAQCGMPQRFDVDAWNEALAFAHGVGDLGYPPPEGRHPNPLIWIGEDNPHIRLDYTQVFDEHRQSSVKQIDGLTVHRSLIIQAGPGHPICASCAVPLELDAGASTETRCPHCHAKASYRLPDGVTRYGAGLVAVVSAEQRSDKPLARLEAMAGGPVALKCPQCGGNMPATKERVVACPFCGTASLIPARGRIRDGSKAIEPEVWWLAFRGPSETRKKLETPVAPSGDDARKKLAGGAVTYLEQAAPKKAFHGKQWAATIGLPLLALALAGLLAGLVMAF